jgi:hypothetical protein
LIPQLVSDTGGYRKMSRADMRFQIWTALAYNIKGFFPFHYHPAKDPDFSDKPTLRYYGNEMARLAVAETLLIAMERDDGLELFKPMDKDILVGCFRDRDDGTYQFAVLGNMNLEKEVSAMLEPKQPDQVLVEIDTHDARISFRQIKSGETITLEPGDGTIVFAGTQDQASKLKTRYWRSHACSSPTPRRPACVSKWKGHGPPPCDPVVRRKREFDVWGSVFRSRNCSYRFASNAARWMRFSNSSRLDR